MACSLLSSPDSMVLPQLQYYSMDESVVAFSTTRLGGYGTGAYGAFNINPYCGDEEKTVWQNRQGLCHLLHISSEHLLMPHQTHQTAVATIDEAFFGLSAAEQRERMEGIDALMTHVPNVCIGVSTADCIPLLLYDPVQRVACAVHAGWRGTVGRIAEKAVRAMVQHYSVSPDHLKTVIAPGISLNSFEVGQEVYDAFSKAGFDMTPISRYMGDKWHIDLPECNRRQLLQNGVQAKHIFQSSACTYQHSNLFFSARRLGIRSGRIFTGILMLPAS